MDNKYRVPFLDDRYDYVPWLDDPKLKKPQNLHKKGMDNKYDDWLSGGVPLRYLVGLHNHLKQVLQPNQYVCGKVQIVESPNENDSYHVQIKEVFRNDLLEQVENEYTLELEFLDIVGIYQTIGKYTGIDGWKTWLEVNKRRNK